MVEVIRRKGKPNKWVLASAVILMLLVVGLAYFFEIYPGIMVSGDTPEQMTITKQQLFGKESKIIEVEYGNQVQAGLMKSYAKYLKNSWCLMVLFSTALIINVYKLILTHHSNQSDEETVMLYVMVGANLLVCILYVYRYFEQLGMIKDLLQQIT